MRIPNFKPGDFGSPIHELTPRVSASKLYPHPYQHHTKRDRTIIPQYQNLDASDFTVLVHIHSYVGFWPSRVLTYKIQEP
jgi:hypothetical protein